MTAGAVRGEASGGLPRTPADVADLVRLLLQDLEGLTERLVDAILAEDPTYRVVDRTPREDLARSCRDNLQSLLRALTGDLDPGLDPFDAPRATGSRRAQQGMPLESVLHAYRLGYRTIWEALVARARDGAGSVDSLVDAASVVWEIVDAFSAAVAGSYRDTEAFLARQDDRRRDAVLDALLDGRGSDRAIAAEAAAVLDLPEHGEYVVVVVEGSGRRERAALAVRGVRAAWRERVDRDVCLAALGRGGLADVLTGLRSVSGRAGVSPPFEGLADADVGQALAATALRALPEGVQQVAELDEHLPGALVVTAPDLAGRLVRRALGPVLDLEPVERDLLLGTLRTWLETGGSAGQTASRLYCHRNTVLNRLRRVEALTGRASDRVDCLVEWSLALQALDLLGAPGAAPAR